MTTFSAGRGHALRSPASRPSVPSLPLRLLLLLGLLGAAAGAPAGVLAAGEPTEERPRCAPDGAAPVDDPAWSTPAGASTAFIPLVVSALVEVGPGRFLYSLAHPEQGLIAAADVTTEVSFYALERDPSSPVATHEGAFLDSPTGRGLYRVNTEFDCAGEWGMELRAVLPDGTNASERVRFQVHADTPTPNVGEPAPRSESLTASSADELALVTTDPDPYPPAYERTVAEVVSAGQPSLVLFATPAFCQTGTCGPALDLVESVAMEYEGRIGFASVEPYRLHMTENGLQPELDAEGRLQPVQAVIDYGIPIEPYLFVVDAAGDVFARFEGMVAEDELRAAIEEVLAASA